MVGFVCLTNSSPTHSIAASYLAGKWTFIDGSKSWTLSSVVFAELLKTKAYVAVYTLAVCVCVICRYH